MLEKYLPRQEFSSYEDFRANYRVCIPDHFNFAYDIVDGWAQLQDDKPALAWIDDQQEEISRYSFGDMKRLSNQAANLFKARGIVKGDTVLLLLKQRVEVWVCLLALHKIGAIAIPASFQLKSKDLVYRFHVASVKMVISVDDPDLLESLDFALSEYPGVQQTLLVGKDIPSGRVDFRKELATFSTDWQKPPEEITPVFMIPC